MKTALALSPIMLALMVPAMLPVPVHPNMNLWLSARHPAMTCCSTAVAQYSVSSATIFTLAAFPHPNTVTVADRDGAFAIINADGSVLVNWSRAAAVADSCYHADKNTAGWEACAIAQVIVQMRRHKAKVLP